MGEYLVARAQQLRAHPSVGDIRAKGLLLGVELVRDKATKAPFSASLEVHRRLRKVLLDRGLSLIASGGRADWVNGDDLRFYPPLIISREQIDEALNIIDEVLCQIEKELGL